VILHGSITARFKKGSKETEVQEEVISARVVSVQGRGFQSFIQSRDSPGFPAKVATRFRNVAETPARPGEIKKAEVVVEKSRPGGAGISRSQGQVNKP
jgi:hypothetical protein